LIPDRGGCSARELLASLCTEEDVGWVGGRPTNHFITPVMDGIIGIIDICRYGWFSVGFMFIDILLSAALSIMNHEWKDADAAADVGLGQKEGAQPHGRYLLPHLSCRVITDYTVIH